MLGSLLRLRSLLTLIAMALLLACPAAAPQWPEDDGFDDHTQPRVDSREQFTTLAGVGPTGTAALKFVILGFDTRKGLRVRYLDGRFYEFHDQWYWFRLLNGHAVPGTRERPVGGQQFETVAEIVEWVRSRDRTPPLGMRFVDDRLYSDRFYELGIHHKPRVWGVGTLVYLPARTGEHARDELWGFELEYADAIDAPDLERFFASLRASLPDDIANELRYIARSPAQTALVERLRHTSHELAARLTSYAELAVPGEIEVYNPGLIAGRLRKLPSDPEQAAKLLTAGDPYAIWIMPTVPDELPAAAGLITATPQTPLAHVNLLARNRGIPNIYVGGVLDDPHFDQLARIHAPVVVQAGVDHTLRVEPISDHDYSMWLGLARPRKPMLDPIDPGGLAYVIELERERLTSVPELRRSVGGKASAFVVLRAAGVEMPERAVAISVRAYVEHLAELRPLIADALASPLLADPRVRYLLLQGRKDFDERFAGAADQAWVAEFLAKHPESAARRDAIANLLGRGGIARAIRDRPIEPNTAAIIETALRQNFGHFAASQGLRFRSSSTVEDLEGFSGAGLYDSNTGFLDADAQADADARKKTVAWALRKTWASYWSWEAFEERHMNGIDHLDGAMAVLVHARFDDERERSNAVLTLTVDLAELRSGLRQAPPGPRAVLEVDVQAGALSVTNPPPERAGEVLPEVDRVVLERADGPIRIERVARSSERDGGVVLDDATLEALLRDSLKIAERWLELDNTALSPTRARSRVTLDLEVREVEAGWPALADGTIRPTRMVIKQVRSLDPGLPVGTERLLDQPLPRDLLLYANRVEKHTCRGRRASLEVLELWTDPAAPLDLGHARVPFVARVRVQARGLGSAPLSADLDHRSFATVAHGSMPAGGPWALDLTLVDANAGFDRVEASAGLLRLHAGNALLGEEPAPCTKDILFASPAEFLRALLPTR